MIYEEGELEETEIELEEKPFKKVILTKKAENCIINIQDEWVEHPKNGLFVALPGRIDIDLKEPALLDLVNHIGDGLKEEWRMMKKEYEEFKENYKKNPYEVEYPKMTEYKDLFDFWFASAKLMK